MRIVKEKRLTEWAEEYPKAQKALASWKKMVKKSAWHSVMEVREPYPHADATTDVKSGREVTIFNICGNTYRMITAIHYNTQKVFVMRFMDHEEYDKENWKETL